MIYFKDKVEEMLQTPIRKESGVEDSFKLFVLHALKRKEEDGISPRDFLDASAEAVSDEYEASEYIWRAAAFGLPMFILQVNATHQLFREGNPSLKEELIVLRQAVETAFEMYIDRKETAEWKEDMEGTRAKNFELLKGLLEDIQ